MLFTKSLADNYKPVLQPLFYGLPDPADNTFTGNPAIAVYRDFLNLHIGFSGSDNHLLFHTAALVIVGLAFRNTFDNLLAGFEIVYGEHIKLGHLIKLGSGEEGHVTKISWTRTTIKSIGGNLVIIPNHKLMANSIINYGAVATISTVNDVQPDLVRIEPSKPADTLSEREKEVLALIGNGATNREIAAKLIISEHTVKSHLRSILNKLNVSNRQQAAVYAERAGLIVETDVPKN